MVFEVQDSFPSTPLFFSFFSLVVFSRRFLYRISNFSLEISACVMVDEDLRVGGCPQAESPPGSLRMFTPL